MGISSTSTACSDSRRLFSLSDVRPVSTRISALQKGDKRNCASKTTDFKGQLATVILAWKCRQTLLVDSVCRVYGDAKRGGTPEGGGRFRKHTVDSCAKLALVQHSACGPCRAPTHRSSSTALSAASHAYPPQTPRLITELSDLRA